MPWWKSRKQSIPEVPNVYIWQQYVSDGYTMRIFVPSLQIDLTRSPGFEVAVREQLDGERFRIVDIRRYMAYVAVQWLWTDAVDSRAKVEQGLRDAEDRVLKLLVEPAGWDGVPLIQYFTSSQDVIRVARERSMGHRWMLGGS